MIYLDTHVVVWLYAGEHRRLSRAGRQLIESESLIISPVLLLELAFLKETGRIKVTAEEILSGLEFSIGLSICDLPFTDVVRFSLQQDWTRDPFDRLIVAQALTRGARLLTKDRHVRQNFKEAVW